MWEEVTIKQFIGSNIRKVLLRIAFNAVVKLETKTLKPLWCISFGNCLSKCVID